MVNAEQELPSQHCVSPCEDYCGLKSAIVRAWNTSRLSISPLMRFETIQMRMTGSPEANLAISSARRRNGKPASCEPCRRDKVRCDHALPTCTRCKDRGITARCFYHPAPLTRTRTRHMLPLAEGVPFDRAALSRYVPT